MNKNNFPDYRNLDFMSLAVPDLKLQLKYSELVNATRIIKVKYEYSYSENLFASLSQKEFFQTTKAR